MKTMDGGSCGQGKRETEPLQTTEDNSESYTMQSVTLEACRMRFQPASDSVGCSVMHVSNANDVTGETITMQTMHGRRSANNADDAVWQRAG